MYNHEREDGLRRNAHIIWIERRAPERVQQMCVQMWTKQTVLKKFPKTKNEAGHPGASQIEQCLSRLHAVHSTLIKATGITA